MGAPKPQHFKFSDIKHRLLHPAQTSVYLVDISSGLTPPLRTFISQYRNVTSEDQLNMRLLCCDASIPGSGMATHEVTGDFHGVTEKMVYRRIYDDTIDLTFYVDYQYKVPDFLEAWFNYCVGEGSTFSRAQYKLDNAYYRMNYPDDYKCDIFLTKFEKTEAISQPAIFYTFLKAFPTNIASIPISYNSSELLKVTVSFSYTRYIRETNLVQTPTEFSGDLTPDRQAKVNKPDPTDLAVPKLDRLGQIVSNEYYNNFGVSSQDATNTSNFFNGRNVDRGVLGGTGFA